MGSHNQSDSQNKHPQDQQQQGQKGSPPGSKGSDLKSTQHQPGKQGGSENEAKNAPQQGKGTGSGQPGRHG